MDRSWVGRTIFACWPCMAMLRLREARHSYMNCENTEECYECAVVSRKMVDQIRSSPTLRHKGLFAYEYLRSCRLVAILRCVTRPRDERVVVQMCM